MARPHQEDDRWRLSSRYLSENNDRRFVRAVIRSGFIAAIEAGTKEIFSADSALTGRYFGVKPNVRSNRLT
jgi:hypothetical protein